MSDTDDAKKAPLDDSMALSEELACNFEEARSHAQKEHEQLTEVARRLEKIFANDGLEFTQTFCGSVPVQAYGRLHGQRFYFRFRGDCAMLRVGFLDMEAEELLRQRDLKRQEEDATKIAQKKASGELAGDELMMEEYLNEWMVRPIPSEDDPDLYPTWIKEYSGLSNVTGEPYNGTLSPEEAEVVFTTLMNTLESCNIRYAVGAVGIPELSADDEEGEIGNV